jgi:hypothetical protein
MGKTLATFGAVTPPSPPICGFTIVKNPPKLIQIPPTIFLKTVIDCK